MLSLPKKVYRAIHKKDLTIIFFKFSSFSTCKRRKFHTQFNFEIV